MKVLIKKINSHEDYLKPQKSENLSVNSGKPCNERDLPCGQNTR